ncbi:MAG: nucleotidyltransferase domain-containing protein [Oscillospiraceae bacterium]|nr:nucleotidyltransferase domain-containing protein [Oscillospiraceae bacterium]
MNEVQRTEINEIVSSILSSVPALEIYLFGSFAKGTEREDSDYDFYVVIPDDSGMRELEANWAIRYSLVGKQKRSIDMLVGTQSKFNRRKDYFYSIENEIKDTGVKLYG